MRPIECSPYSVRFFLFVRQRDARARRAPHVRRRDARSARKSFRPHRANPSAATPTSIRARSSHSTRRRSAYEMVWHWRRRDRRSCGRELVERDLAVPPHAGDVMRKVLIAGIGNIFLGDDGFGVEVARRMLEQPSVEGVEVADFGICGIHLAYELAGGGYDAAVLVDAVHRDGKPGTLYV